MNSKPATMQELDERLASRQRKVDERLNARLGGGPKTDLPETGSSKDQITVCINNTNLLGTASEGTTSPASAGTSPPASWHGSCDCRRPTPAWEKTLVGHRWRRYFGYRFALGSRITRASALGREEIGPDAYVLAFK